ncbi:MAG TPA: hypothetical protein ENN85_02105 [Methanoculleus sp.]|nr:hypothetical protein [Methanoculleus sp.]
MNSDGFTRGVDDGFADTKRSLRHRRHLPDPHLQLLGVPGPLGEPRKSADRIPKKFADAGIIEVIAEKERKRPAMYIFPRLFAITEDGLV